ncbi:hypothetical protein HN789_04445 [archaeon]|jgi:hypothetical protein|nr:hypothetical protein [archaeon]MBT4271733.1 hypothetical protein [archaeon]MBT4461747.1 hypothetical protein [archaeon]MBT4857889.1 hypothetical protein [archaeon]MBT5423444.1 hypothetical protein [archaeon]
MQKLYKKTNLKESKMITISELRVIEDTFFKSNLVYYKPSIYKLLDKYFKEENEYSEATDVKLKNLIKTDNIMAYNNILKGDVKKLRKELKTTPKQFDENLWRGMLPKIRDLVVKNLGMDFKPRSVFFEDSFPEGLGGFEAKGASSITIFEGNKDAGIYFLNKRISSFFSPILLIHEQLHSCLSQNKDKNQMYIEWFEEGLCQWYSLKIYFELTKNKNVLEYYKHRCYIFSKAKDEHNFTKRYYEYMKIFSKLYLHGGQKLIGKMLLDYLANKRNNVNSYLTKKLPVKEIPKSDIEQYLVSFAVEVEPEKIPPVEYLVLKEITIPKTIEEISKKIKVPVDFLQKVVFALHLKGMVVMKDEKKIEMNWRKKDLFEKDLIKPFWPLKR